MSKQAVNTFKQGLVMDLNPLANDNKSLTNALNATFITQNGNELMLQNDMGNGRINRVRLDDGYIPVGIKEYGGIIYIASYNPKNGKGQIGSFPYPKLEWENSDFTNSSITLNQIYGDEYISAKTQDGFDCIVNFYEILNNSIKIPLLVDNSGEQLKIKSGDSFSISFDSDTIEFLKSPNINIKLIVKTSSNYYTISDNKIDIVNGTTFIYNGTYSGFVYLEISLVTYDNFEVDYLIKDNYIEIYPRAFNKDNSNISYNAVLLEDLNQKNNSDLNYTNLNCNSKPYRNYIENSLGKTYYIYPVTSDGGYVKDLRRELNIPDQLNSNNISQFKYTVDNNILKLLYEFQYKDDNYNQYNNITYTYRFYPIKAIQNSINSYNDLQNLHKSNLQTIEVSKSGYTTKSGVRYLEVELPDNDIYLFVVNCGEEVLFTRFVYGTSRYNEYYNSYKDYNLIEKEDSEVEYTLDSNLFQAELDSISHKHFYTYLNEWVPSQDLVKYSEEQFTDQENLPSKFGTEIGVILNKTSNTIIECIPEENYKYIFDKESFSIPAEDILITFQKYNDAPQKNSSNIIEYPDQKLPVVNQEQQFFKFYRYISSGSNDGIIQQDRVLKTIAPVFDPNSSTDELVGYSYGDTYMEAVVCSKKFLSDSSSRNMNPLVGNNVSTPSNFSQSWEANLSEEDSLSSGSVKLSNLQSALLNHSSSIFDIVAGGNSEDADWASLKIKRSLNSDDDAGIKSAHGDQINATDDWMIATCLNIKGKPMPINLASRCVSKVFSSGTFVGPYINSDGQLQEVSQTQESQRPLITRDNLYKLSYINVGKKLQCILSQVFTLQNLDKNIYLIGPSLNTLNYNIQDNSYFNYTCRLKNCNFTKDVDYILDTLSSSLYNINNTNNCYAINYIGSVNSKVLQNSYNYGHLVNLDSSLYNHILSQYENAYDNEEILDESNGFHDDEIYYLDAEQINILNNQSSISTDSESNEIWDNKGIRFNANFHCFQYDLGKFDISLIKQSKASNKYDCLIDWTGKLWKLNPLTNNFITVFKAQREYSNIISGITNNYILLNKNTADIKTQWEYHSNTSGPSIVYIDFGLRGLCKRKNSSYNIESLENSEKFESRIVDIINTNEFEELKNKGYYEYNT